MTNKQKFEQIDQSKLNDAQKNLLSQIKDKTTNFTNKDKDLNAKISTSLDGIIAKLKQSMPEALKSTSKEVKSKRTAMGLAKEIRKADETWKDALIRARKQMKKDGESATEIIKSEIGKLKQFIKEHKELEGLHGTDLKRDSVRRAKPKGRRVSENGNVYYEYRDNRTDRLAPNYPKGAPKLEDGGDFMSSAYANDGMMLGNSNGMEEDIDLSDDNKMRIKKMDYQYKRKSAKEIAEKHNAAAFEYMNNEEKEYNFGGIFANTFTGETGTHYTGLVGETNAMSSGEMFKDGGAIKNQYAGRNAADIWDNLTYEQKRHFLFDHEDEFPERMRGYYIINELAKRDFENSPKEIKFHFELHVKTGQYEDGGGVGDMTYWEQYHEGGESTKFKNIGNFELQQIVQGNIEDWNDNNEMGKENEVTSVGEKKVIKLAKDFVKAKGYISSDIIDAMIAQESHEDVSKVENKLKPGIYRVGEPVKSGNMYQQKVAIILNNGKVRSNSEFGMTKTDFIAIKNPMITEKQFYALNRYANGGLMDVHNGTQFMDIPVYKRGGMMKYHKGGNLGQHGLDEGDTIIKTIGSFQKIKDKKGNTLYVDLSSGYRDSQPPLPFKNGGNIN